MKTYFFQVKETGLCWESTPAIEETFESRVIAVHHATLLAAIMRREVRLTDNKKLLQGSYFRP